MKKILSFILGALCLVGMVSMNAATDVGNPYWAEYPAQYITPPTNQIGHLTNDASADYTNNNAVGFFVPPGKGVIFQTSIRGNGSGVAGANSGSNNVYGFYTSLDGKYWNKDQNIRWTIPTPASNTFTTFTTNFSGLPALASTFSGGTGSVWLKWAYITTTSNNWAYPSNIIVKFVP